MLASEQSGMECSAAHPASRYEHTDSNADPIARWATSLIDDPFSIDPLPKPRQWPDGSDPGVGNDTTAQTLLYHAVKLRNEDSAFAEVRWLLQQAQSRDPSELLQLFCTVDSSRDGQYRSSVAACAVAYGHVKVVALLLALCIQMDQENPEERNVWHLLSHTNHEHYNLLMCAAMGCVFPWASSAPEHRSEQIVVMLLNAVSLRPDSWRLSGTRFHSPSGI